MTGSIIQYSQDDFSFPARKLMEHLASLTEEEFRKLLRKESRDGWDYLILSISKKVYQGISTCPATISEEAEFLGTSFDAQAHDLRKMAQVITGKIEAVVAEQGDLGWILDGCADGKGKVADWKLDTLPARLESVQGLRRWTSEADGVLLLVREQRDTDFLPGLRRKLIERLTDPLSEDGLDSVEAEARVDRALSSDISQKFIGFVRSLAIERSRIGVMLTLARSLLPVLERDPQKNAVGARYLRFILDMYDSVLHDPCHYPLGSGFGTDDFVQELHKLMFFNRLPIWFVSHGVLGREDSGESVADLVSYSLRIGGENPVTGNLAVVDRILQAASDPNRAYMPAILVYAMLFEPELKASSVRERYDKAMKMGWKGIRDRWMEQKPGTSHWVLKKGVQERIQKELEAIRKDIFWALQRTTDNPLGEQLTRGASRLTQDVIVSVDASLMSHSLEKAIVEPGSRTDDALQGYWFRHIRVNDERRHQDDEWFRMRVSAVPDARLLVTEKESREIKIHRGPVGSERVLRVQMYPPSRNPSLEEDPGLRRQMVGHRDVRLFIPVRFDEADGDPNPTARLVWYFAQAWLIEKFLSAIVARLHDQGWTNLRLDMLRLQNGGRNDSQSNRMYGFCHLIEHRLANRLPVFQQGIDVSTGQYGTGKYRIGRANAMVSHVWPMQINLPLETDVALVHLSRFREDNGRTVQALARAFVATPSEGGFRYGHYRTWSRASKDVSHSSLFAEGWILSSVLQGLRDIGVSRVLLLVSADAWMRVWKTMERSALEELDAVYEVSSRILGENAVVVPMAWRKHLLLMRKETKVDRPRVLDGIDALSGILSPLSSTSSIEASRQRIYACQGFATLRTVRDLSPQRGLMAYGFLHVDSRRVSEKSEMARQMALARSGWVHHILLAHHAYAYEKIQTVSGNIAPANREPPIKLDPWSMENNLADRACEMVANGKRKGHTIVIDWLSLLSTFDLQTASVRRVTTQDVERADD